MSVEDRNRKGFQVFDSWFFQNNYQEFQEEDHDGRRLTYEENELLEKARDKYWDKLSEETKKAYRSFTDDDKEFQKWRKIKDLDKKYKKLEKFIADNALKIKF
jgi:hypothetical protein